ncbi:MAG TPA: hypothetical protein VEC37_12065 [Bacillota bacterium]|nr:hypothetical protein [Bacillota bacterium]
MRRLKIIGYILGLLLLVVMNSGVLFCFDFKEVLDFKNYKLPDPLEFWKPSHRIRQFNSLPVYDNEVIKILKKRQPGFSKEKLLTNGYTFPFTTLAGDVNLKKPGFITISNQGVDYDQISSFLITRNESNNRCYIEFNGSKPGGKTTDFELMLNNCYIINVDEGFLRKHSVAVHKLSEVNTAAIPDDLLPKVEAYLYPLQKRGKLDFVRKNESAATLRRRLADNFEYRVYQVTDLTRPKLLIACFEPKKEKSEDFNSFCFIFVNGKINRYGHFSDFIIFSIDRRFYLEFFNQVIPGSGYWGKVLYTLEGGKINFVEGDYTFAD